MRKIALLLLIFITISGFAREECTTAVISGKATVDGAPILWKNRDTDHLYNKVIFVEEKPYSYIAIVNNNEVSGRIVWSGLNEKGFAIMNSAAYNLPLRSGESKDLEGIIMAEALRKCKTVNDFENFIKANLGESLGAQANFGVIDANGNAALFEVYNHGYKRFNASDFKQGYIVNTNFSRSGEKGKGFGYVRFMQVEKMFKARKKLSHSYIIVSVIRNIDNPLIPIIPMEKWRYLSNKKPYFVYTYDCVNRSYTANAFVVHGVNSPDKAKYSTMWVALGEPVTTIAVPLWVCTKSTPYELRGGDKAPIAIESMRLKDKLRPFKKGKMREYLDLTKLDNRQNTGWIRRLRDKQAEILTKTRLFLEKNPDCNELKDFQEKMAKEAYKFLKNIK
ncbi:conserved hypothetical protein [Thermotomaculum hydrothermale]|uniref:Peptidase C45 hydrolase domain-containing protein n=1 Tax=Thermotomaculum hydrothermale TaxID=981385 RepID=A0A7R6T008_9BACT|nr:carcinine hydrolase/isopenicillin-N N-acyltransferase family protein [Thermotomaculum hydrothermale]BBB33315.1 conserved hypothetical protein [Thermotomaculum hydrothermale]